MEEYAILTENNNLEFISCYFPLEAPANQSYEKV